MKLRQRKAQFGKPLRENTAMVARLLKKIKKINKEKWARVDKEWEDYLWEEFQNYADQMLSSQFGRLW